MSIFPLFFAFFLAFLSYVTFGVFLSLCFFFFIALYLFTDLLFYMLSMFVNVVKEFCKQILKQ